VNEKKRQKAPVKKGSKRKDERVKIYKKSEVKKRRPMGGKNWRLAREGNNYPFSEGGKILLLD
jgi:hypothetical protein